MWPQFSITVGWPFAHGDQDAGPLLLEFGDGLRQQARRCRDQGADDDMAGIAGAEGIQLIGQVA